MSVMRRTTSCEVKEVIPFTGYVGHAPSRAVVVVLRCIDDVSRVLPGVISDHHVYISRHATMDWKLAAEDAESMACDMANNRNIESLRQSLTEILGKPGEHLEVEID